MVFSNSILPNEAAYYELYQATIIGGIMSLQKDGYAKYTISDKVLPALTENFRVSVLPVNAVDPYEPKVHVYVSAKTKDGKYYNYTLTPSAPQGIVYTDIITFEASEYEYFTFTVYALEATNLQLWELCPESSDANAEIIIEGVKQSLPRLLYDYNMFPLSVTQDAGVIGMITFNLLNQTDLQGHLAVSYVASEDCVLTLRVLDNYVTELYMPIVYDLKAGRGNLTLPHAYLDRLAGIHTTMITAQVSNGAVAINTRGLLYTIDGGYLAEREADVGMQMLDFSIQQPVGSSSPAEVWIVGIDAGEALVRSRAYDADASTGFTAQYSLGPAKDAAIEFDGEFRLRDDLHTLYTDSVPFAFWIDNSNVLWCQYGSDVDTKQQLDTDVTSISACRAFKSNFQSSNDQGLIALYIKNGVATYKNYCYVDEERYEWQGPFIIDTDSPAIKAQVHRLNDYRVGFAIATSSQSLWLISDRTYVNQAVAPEVVSVSYDKTYPIIAMTTNGTVYPDIRVTATMEDDHVTAHIVFNHIIKSVDDVDTALFAASGSNIESVIVDTDHSLLIKIDTPNLLGTTFVYSNPDGNLRYSPDGGISWFRLEAFSVVAPGYNYNETVNVTYKELNAKIKIRGIETIQPDPQTEQVNVTYSALESSITILPITTSQHTMPSEHVRVSYNGVSATITITQTGVIPI